MSDAHPKLEFRDSLSDEDVVARVLEGHVELFELLMRRYNARVYRTVRIILRNDAEAEDVMQEAYVAAFSHLSDFAARSRFSTWLTRIAVNESLARLRRGRRLEPLGDVETEARPMASPARNPEQRASDLELRAILEQAIDALPDGFRAVFVLRAVEQLSVAETSEALDVPEETVKTRLHRARGLLRESLTDRVGTTLPTVFDFHLARCDRVVEGVLGRIRALG